MAKPKRESDCYSYKKYTNNYDDDYDDDYDNYYDNDDNCDDDCKEVENIILSFGKNNKYQTGHNINKINIYNPQIIQFNLKSNPNPISIGTGFDHSGMIDNNGNVILWGDNTNHQISNYKSSSYLLPHQLSLQMKIKQIALSGNSSLFLDISGKVWNAGGGGNNNNNLNLIKFPFIKRNEYIKFIECGYQHFGAISNYNNIYLWGNNRYNQLGLGYKYKHLSYIDSPILLSWKTGIIKCKMGRWHTLILDENGYIYSCGWGRFGVLGLNNTYNQSTFQYIPVKTAKHDNHNDNDYDDEDLRIIDIECGAVHSCCVTEYGQIYIGSREIWPMWIRK